MVDGGNLIFKAIIGYSVSPLAHWQRWCYTHLSYGCGSFIIFVGASGQYIRPGKKASKFYEMALSASHLPSFESRVLFLPD